MSNDTQATDNYTFTPERQREAFEYVADNVLMLTVREIDALTDIGANTILTFINMSTADLASLQVVDDDGMTKTPLPISSRNTLLLFRYYLHYLDHIDNTPFGEQWFKLTQRDFNNFRQSHWVKYYRGKTLCGSCSGSYWKTGVCSQRFHYITRHLKETQPSTAI